MSEKDPQFKQKPKSTYTFFQEGEVNEISKMGVMVIYTLCLRNPRETPLYIYELWRTNRLDDVYTLQREGGISVEREDIINIGAILMIEGGFGLEETSRFFFETAVVSLKTEEGIPYEDDLQEGDLPLIKFEVGEMVEESAEIAGNSNFHSNTSLN